MASENFIFSVDVVLVRGSCFYKWISVNKNHEGFLFVWNHNKDSNYGVQIKAIHPSVKSVEVTYNHLNGNRDTKKLENETWININLFPDVQTVTLSIDVAFTESKNQVRVFRETLELEEGDMRALNIGEYCKKKFALESGLELDYSLLKHITFKNNLESTGYTLVFDARDGIKVNDQTGSARIPVPPCTKSLLLTFLVPVDIGGKYPETSPSTIDMSDKQLIKFPSGVYHGKTTAQRLEEVFEHARFTDVVIRDSNGEQFYFHRAILADASEVFNALFQEHSEVPIFIDVPYPADILCKGIGYMYGRVDQIKGHEAGLIDFADKYSIHGLKDACKESLFKNLTVQNVCEVVEIAFLHNFETLKTEALKILTEKKAEIGEDTIKSLSPPVVVSMLSLL